MTHHKSVQVELDRSGITHEAEVNLIEFAHTLAMNDDDYTATTGRALKAIIPGWVAFINDEIARGSHPAHTIGMLVRSFGHLTGYLSGMARNPASTREEINEKLVEAFEIALSEAVALTGSEVEDFQATGKLPGEAEIKGDGFVLYDANPIQC